jgi:hypothetical protein
MGEDIGVKYLYIVCAPKDKVLDRDVKWNGDTMLPAMDGTGDGHEDCPRASIDSSAVSLKPLNNRLEITLGVCRI